MKLTIDSIDPPFESDNMHEIFQVYYERASNPRRMADSWHEPYRRHISQAISEVMPVGSVYELGCGAGANLRRLQEDFPGLKLGGCDYAEPLAAAAAEWGDIEVRTLPCEVGPEWDVTLTCFTLAYLDPQELQLQLKLIQTPYLVIAEPMLAEQTCALIFRLGGSLPFWSHDYVPFLHAAGWTGLRTADLPDGPDNLNRIILAKRGA